ncbi:hypothetical protein D9758_012574 [Tetrapyrgos nigripes]|uniref:N-acetyltransferase domain-containing protein n=1 Tax=Tetrapyrgos nigripes TaxID=182062 RepID=A0A8H5FM86_9AGAR|nr:hypothetical protein D9758_012574 [Tetrapyrgos nigripes]
MQDEQLQQLTASEPLSLEEEYEMQRKWRDDEDKLTFIILAREPNEGPSPPFNDDEASTDASDPCLESLPMVGDVNLFFSGTLNPEKAISEPSNDITNPDGRDADGDDEDAFSAEAEIMIAEPAYRRRGFAFEALQLMLQYASGCPPGVFSLQPCTETSFTSERSSFPSLPNAIPPDSLLTRISENNMASISLFENLGFQVMKHVKVFEEVEMRWRKRS